MSASPTTDREARCPPPARAWSDSPTGSRPAAAPSSSTVRAGRARSYTRACRFDTTRWTSGRAPKMIRAVSDSGVLGREQERERLTRLLDGVGAGGGALLLAGEAGVGKSTLLNEAAEAAAARGMLVLGTAGIQSEADLP